MLDILERSRFARVLSSSLLPADIPIVIFVSYRFTLSLPSVAIIFFALSASDWYFCILPSSFDEPSVFAPSSFTPLESSFEIVTNNQSGITQVSAPRDLSVFNSSSFSQTISKKLDLCKSRKLILDMSALSFIDSSGLGSLATLNEICRRKGISMVIYGVSMQILQVLRITRVDRIVQITRTKDEALKGD